MGYSEVLVFHHIVVVVILLFFLLKTILVFLPDEKHLINYRAKTKWAEIITGILVVLSGIYLVWVVPELGNWFFVKIIILIVSISLGIVGYKRHRLLFALLCFIGLSYVYYASATKSSPLHQSWIPKIYQQEQLADIDPVSDEYNRIEHGHYLYSL